MIALNPEEKDGMHDKNTVHASRFMGIQNSLGFLQNTLGSGFRGRQYTICLTPKKFGVKRDFKMNKRKQEI